MTDNKRREQECLLLDSRSNPLTQCVLLGRTGAEELQIRVPAGEEDEVAQHELVQLVSMGSDGLAVQCQILRQRGDILLLTVIESLDPEFRRNLRVPVDFKSFIYPISGAWRGRREIQSVDISCGGIAFYGTSGLEDGERLEVVIPITVQPMVLRCQILKHRQLHADRVFHAAKFVDMCNDEETMVREAVFRTQLRDRSKYMD